MSWIQLAALALVFGVIVGAILALFFRKKKSRITANRAVLDQRVAQMQSDRQRPQAIATPLPPRRRESAPARIQLTDNYGDNDSESRRRRRVDDSNDLLFISSAHGQHHVDLGSTRSANDASEFGGSNHSDGGSHGGGTHATGGGYGGSGYDGGSSSNDSGGGSDSGGGGGGGD